MTKLRLPRTFTSLAPLLALLCSLPPAQADIFQWEYIDSSDPGQGKQQSTILVPDGGGIIAMPGADLKSRDLTQAYLVGASLGPDIWSYDEYGYPLYFVRSDLTGSNLESADLSNATLIGANLTGANLSGAYVKGAIFSTNTGYFNFGGSGISAAQLYSTASYQAQDLAGIQLGGINLSGITLAQQKLTGASFLATTLIGANLSQSDLTNAYLGYASLADANLMGAEVRGADFYFTDLTSSQLYATASYQAGNLAGVYLQGTVLANVNLSGVNLSHANFQGAYLAGANMSAANLAGANFAGDMFFWGGANLSGADLSFTNLQNAIFSGNSDSPGADLTGANLTSADVRGAGFYRPRMDAANTTNLIQSNGHIAGLSLTSGATLTVRDYDGNPTAPLPVGQLPIVVDHHLTMDSTGALQLEFDADDWGSTISFAPGSAVTLGGNLELVFASAVDVASQVGRTINVFDWTGVTRAGEFNVLSPYSWDLSKLYSTGEVTLLPSTALAGDYNGDGAVNLADYTVWRNHLGDDTLANRGAGITGPVGELDYETWKENFGQSLESSQTTGLQAAVPEPASVVLILSCAILWGVARNLRWCRKGLT